MTDIRCPPTAVQEVQGLYGPFTFSEKLLQQIWQRGDFQQEPLRTLDGRRLRILHAGRWNLLGGPDFKEARLQWEDEPSFTGDVELHLNAGDWAAHRHAEDRAYDRVRLHVVLFPPPDAHVTYGAGGQVIPTLVLLPLLNHDLEEYAADAAIESLAGRPLSEASGVLWHLAPDKLVEVLREHARQRWRQKVRFARLRVEKLGWRQACHHTALEILGYRFNRVPMLQIAARHPLEAWAVSRVDPERIYEEEAGRWSLQGVRPANQPRRRLRQYALWATALPDWPEQLAAITAELPEVNLSESTRHVRQQHGLTARREALARTLCAGQIGGTRLDNLVCDGWLPLLAAHAGRDLGGLWYHWFTGDLPPFLARALRELKVCDGRAQPASHGLAQGLLGRLLAQEAPTR